MPNLEDLSHNADDVGAEADINKMESIIPDCRKSASTPIDAEKPLLKDSDAYSDSDYAGASLDKKSTNGGCQFLGCRLISWQCKKQTVVATSSTEAEYVAAASGCAQVL
nr:putative ribonuclease H-like domain-containing protein [Tanacetum cinerariifolium]